MIISYLGHSCFLLENQNKSKLLLDPYEFIGYSLPKVSAETVVISHNHFDHNNDSAVDGVKEVINGENKFVNGFLVTSIKTFHDKEKGKLRGENYIHVIEADGYKICHLGDYGDDVDNIPEIFGIDILMIPVGSVYTIDGKEAYLICQKLKPKKIIPMHYKTADGNIKVLPIENFLQYFDQKEIVKFKKQIDLSQNLTQKIIVIEK